MSDAPLIIAELTFLTSEEGGRKHPPGPHWSAGGPWYMPHAVVDGQSEYLGVRFVGGPAVVAGQLNRFELALVYPAVDYSALQPGVGITLREGGKIVARGRVLERR